MSSASVDESRDAWRPAAVFVEGEVKSVPDTACGDSVCCSRARARVILIGVVGTPVKACEDEEACVAWVCTRLLLDNTVEDSTCEAVLARL